MKRQLQVMLLGAALSVGCRETVAPRQIAEGDLDVAIPSVRALPGLQNARVTRHKVRFAPQGSLNGLYVAKDEAGGAIITDKWTVNTLEADSATIESGMTYWGTGASQTTTSSFSKLGQEIMTDEMPYTESNGAPLGYDLSVRKGIRLTTRCGVTVNSSTSHTARLQLVNLPLLETNRNSNYYSSQVDCVASGSGGSSSRTTSGWVLTVCDYEAILDQYGNVWYIDSLGCTVYEM